jgi:hypothetical protein
MSPRLHPRDGSRRSRGPCDPLSIGPSTAWGRSDINSAPRGPNHPEREPPCGVERRSSSEDGRLHDVHGERCASTPAVARVQRDPIRGQRSGVAESGLEPVPRAVPAREALAGSWPRDPLAPHGIRLASGHQPDRTPVVGGRAPILRTQLARWRPPGHHLATVRPHKEQTTMRVGLGSKARGYVGIEYAPSVAVSLASGSHASTKGGPRLVPRCECPACGGHAAATWRGP